MNQKHLALMIAIAGVGVSLSPLPIPTKLLVAPSAGGVCLYYGLEDRGKRLRTSSFTGRQQQALTEREALLAEKEKSLQENLERETCKIAQAKHELSLLQDKIEAERAAMEERLLLSLQMEEERNRLAIAREWEKLKLAEQQFNIEQEQMIAEAIAEAEEMIAIKQQEWEEQKAEEVAEAERRIAIKQQEWEKQKAATIKEIAEAEEELALEHVERTNQLVEELKEVKAELEEQAKKQYEAWLVPHCQEMDAKIKQIEALKATIEALRLELAEGRDIKLCLERGKNYGARANEVLIWFKERGIYLDYESAAILPDSTFVLNFRPWQFSGKTEKAIKAELRLAFPSAFGLDAEPLFQGNPEMACWTITCPARTTELAIADFYRPSMPSEMRVGETFRDIELSVRDGVARKLNYQEQVTEMLNFRPPVKIERPRSWQITELEMDTCRWYYLWRSQATGEPNVTTREGLLWHVYGVREGGTTSRFDPVLNESLGQRVTRILSLLNLEAIALEEQANA